MLRCATTNVKTEADGSQTIYQGWATMGAGSTCLAFTGPWCAPSLSCCQEIAVEGATWARWALA